MSKTEDVANFGSALFTRMREMNRAWLERLRAIRAFESEFGGRLLNAKSPSEATAICNEWMAKRLEAVGNEHKAFTVAWLDLVSSTIQSAASGKATEPTPHKES